MPARARKLHRLSSLHLRRLPKQLQLFRPRRISSALQRATRPASRLLSAGPLRRGRASCHQSLPPHLPWPRRRKPGRRRMEPDLQRRPRRPRQPEGWLRRNPARRPQRARAPSRHLRRQVERGRRVLRSHRTWQQHPLGAKPPAESPPSTGLPEPRPRLLPTEAPARHPSLPHPWRKKQPTAAPTLKPAPNIFEQESPSPRQPTDTVWVSRILRWWLSRARSRIRTRRSSRSW
jgi:hypothetical protein